MNLSHSSPREHCLISSSSTNYMFWGHSQSWNKTNMKNARKWSHISERIHFIIKLCLKGLKVNNGKNMSDMKKTDYCYMGKQIKCVKKWQCLPNN